MASEVGGACVIGPHKGSERLSEPRIGKHPWILSHGFGGDPTKSSFTELGTKDLRVSGRQCG